MDYPDMNLSIRETLVLVVVAFGCGAVLGYWQGTHRSPAPLRYSPSASISLYDPNRPRPKTVEERTAELVRRRIHSAGMSDDSELVKELMDRFLNRKHESFPVTGVLTSAYHEDPLTPLTIKTKPGSYYFVKLLERPSNRTVMTAFISGGSAFETTVPLGSYELRYAAGGEWYGSLLDFGPTASYYRSPELFEFTSSNSQYLGYTVELVLQQGGNLRTTRIDPEEF